MRPSNVRSLGTDEAFQLRQDLRALQKDARAWRRQALREARKSRRWRNRYFSAMGFLFAWVLVLGILL